MEGMGSNGTEEELLQAWGQEPGKNGSAGNERRFSNTIEKTKKILLSLVIRRHF